MTDELSYGKIIKPELCVQYKEKLLSLPDIIQHTTLDSIVSSLFACFYTQALQEVCTVAIQKDRILDTKKRERVRSLLEKARATKEETVLKDLFSQPTKDSYQIRIIKPGSPPKKLGEYLAIIGNCWIRDLDGLKSKSVMNKVRWLQKDIDLGACLFLISENLERPKWYSREKYVPKVQTRAYIATTKKDETILFYDTIEGGSISCDSVYQWVYSNRGRELLYSVAAMIYIAKEYGVKKIGVGEREVQELATKLGFKEETLFEKNDTRYITEKIGFVGDQDGDSGPYCYGLQRSTERRVIPLDEIKVLPEDNIEKRLEELTDFLGSFKKTRKNKNKMEEVGIYLECLKVINELNANSSKEISKKINLLQKKYFDKEAL